MGPVAYAPNQFSDVSWAMQRMSVLPVPEPEPFVFIDPNLLSEVCSSVYVSYHRLVGGCMRAQLPGCMPVWFRGSR